MINSRGETIYTNAEVAYELGIAPATVNAVGKRLFGGGKIPHWTLHDVKLICQYIKSISVEEDAKRLAALHSVVGSIMGPGSLDEEEVEARVQKDLRNVTA